MGRAGREGKTCPSKSRTSLLLCRREARVKSKRCFALTAPSRKPPSALTRLRPKFGEPRAPGCCPLLDELEAFCLVVGQAGLEEDRVHTELGVQEGHVPVHLDEEVDALVSLVEVRIIVRKCLGAPGAAESPAGGHLE